MTDHRQLAGALADAMLAGRWELGPIRYRTRRVIGRRRAWVEALAAEVTTAYLRPPSDRQRELQEFVLRSGAFERGLVVGPLPRIEVRLTSTTTTVRRPFHTPVVDDAGRLADRLGISIDELVSLADTRLIARRARSERIAHYRYRWIARPTGGRLLEAPKDRLKTVQRAVLDELLSPIPMHPAAHGFVPGRSAGTGAALHVGAEVVITLDLEHFFAAITAGRIWGVLRSAGFPEPVAHLLAGLTTHATPVSALGRMPAGPDGGRDIRLRRRLAAPHLPQGAPTSPQLANLVAFALDRRLAAYAGTSGACYTRYADDLCFSGGAGLARRSGAFTAGVARIVGDSGFTLNPAKTRTRRPSQRQAVTGIVVNDRPNIARPDVDRLKAVLHQCRTRGPAESNREGLSDFRSHLLGRVSWVAAVNPARGAALRREFDLIDWRD
ncbi:reverse transcriptase family protein [Nakamurella sp. GG22]